MAEHGTRARYQRQGCRCEPCRHAQTAYDKRRRNARRHGPAYIDATEARQHLNWLATQGVGVRTVADRTGLSSANLTRIATGERASIRPTTAARILAVHVGLAAPGAHVDATRTNRQLTDLLAAGYTRHQLARHLGYRSGKLQLGDRQRVTRANAERVDALWRALLRR